MSQKIEKRKSRAQHGPTRRTLAVLTAGPRRRSSKGSKATKAQLLKLDLGFRPISRALLPQNIACRENGGGGKSLHSELMLERAGDIYFVCWAHGGGVSGSTTEGALQIIRGFLGEERNSSWMVHSTARTAKKKNVSENSTTCPRCFFWRAAAARGHRNTKTRQPKKKKKAAQRLPPLSAQTYVPPLRHDERGRGAVAEEGRVGRGVRPVRFHEGRLQGPQFLERGLSLDPVLDGAPIHGDNLAGVSRSNGRTSIETDTFRDGSHGVVTAPR